ncbi:MAG: leucyl/phenylalanyl-tRNA--protein transferase [Polyangiaceae bacterium]|nr:leucyl/phenylalanyl-tRNA--protein transferase [Polyangiaceae bacterium]
MPVYRLDQRLIFPPADRADDSGLLAVGGDLSPERLLLAYQSGIFPWYEDGLPILWHSPNPRYVLEASKLHVPRSLEKQMRRAPYRIALDTRFRDVMQACATTKRPGQRGTWITRDMLDAYVRLHTMGFAHSAEAYDGDQLVGGLYGVALGGVFFGESMFAAAPDASKIAFATLVRWLASHGIDLVDCQVHTEHLERFGAEAWPRKKYLTELRKRLDRPTVRGRWSMETAPLVE